jgi:hypothetical protein
MPNVLTTTSTVLCGHGGSGAVQVQSDAKLKLNGARVLLMAGIKDQPINPVLCGIPVPPAANKKCTKASSVFAGLATKLKVGDLPVVLETVRGGTDGTIGGAVQLLMAAVPAPVKLRSV